MHTGLSNDVYWHWAAGLWMLHHHRILGRDIFSYTVRSKAWRTPEWGYNLVLAGSVRLLGKGAFWLLSAGLETLTVLVVAIRARVAGAGWTWTGLLTLEAGAGVTLLLTDRPQMVSYLLFAVLLLLLAKARRHRRLLIAVPPLFALWANLHGSFLLGLLVLLLEVAAALIPLRKGRVAFFDPLPSRAAALTCGAAALAVLANPFGLGDYANAFEVTSNPIIRQTIAEWQSPNFHDLRMLAVVVLPIFVTVSYLALSRAKVNLSGLVLAGVLLVATLSSVRFLPYFAIAWCSLAASCSPLQREQLRPRAIVWPVLVLLSFSFLHGPWIAPGRPAPGLPVKAASWLEAREGRVFSTYVWDDYLIWRHVPVFIDGRTELYTGTPVFQQYLRLSELATDPDRVFASYRVRYVLWPAGTPLAVYLQHDSHWRVTWRGRGTVVFRRA
jgi:hypothetical protein